MPGVGVADVLGGAKTLKRKISGFDDLHVAVRSGLPFATLEALIHRLQLSIGEAAAVLRIPARTMARRKRARKLPPDESDRVLRLARVYAHASQVFEDEDEAAGWFKDPNVALGGKRPLELLDTDIGTQRVDALLTRIRHGVYS